MRLNEAKQLLREYNVRNSIKNFATKISQFFKKNAHSNNVNKIFLQKVKNKENINISMALIKKNGNEVQILLTPGKYATNNKNDNKLYILGTFRTKFHDNDYSNIKDLDAFIEKEIDWHIYQSGFSDAYGYMVGWRSGLDTVINSITIDDDVKNILITVTNWDENYLKDDEFKDVFQLYNIKDLKNNKNISNKIKSILPLLNNVK